MARQLEGRGGSVLNVLGMAQKNGAVARHVRFPGAPDEAASWRIGPGGADCILATGASVTAAPETLQAIVDRRAAFLVDYQDRAYAKRYRDFVERVTAEEAAATGSEELARAVARYYFKLLAYKDEYEVARLYTDGSF